MKMKMEQLHWRWQNLIVERGNTNLTITKNINITLDKANKEPKNRRPTTNWDIHISQSGIQSTIPTEQ